MRMVDALTLKSDEGRSWLR